MLGKKGHDRRVVGALPVDIDRDANRVLAGLEGLGEERRIHIPAFRRAVDEHRSGSDVSDGIESGGEREAGDEDPIALADAE